MSKAKERELRVITERVSFLINKRLEEFEDRYLGAYVKWSIGEIEYTLKRYVNMKKEQSSTAYDLIIERREVQLSKPHILACEYYAEAKKGYDIKIAKLVAKLIQHGITTPHLKVEKVNNAGSELSFLISNAEMEIHARMIWAEGDINAPHYRFITTKRNK